MKASHYCPEPLMPLLIANLLATINASPIEFDLPDEHDAPEPDDELEGDHDA